MKVVDSKDVKRILRQAKRGTAASGSLDKETMSFVIERLEFFKIDNSGGGARSEQNSSFTSID